MEFQLIGGPVIAITRVGEDVECARFEKTGRTFYILDKGDDDPY